MLLKRLLGPLGQGELLSERHGDAVVKVAVQDAAHCVAAQLGPQLEVERLELPKECLRTFGLGKQVV